MAVESFKNITMTFEGTGLKAVIDDVTVTKYAASIKGLTLEQANLALSTTQLSATEKERVLTEAGLIAQTEKLTATDAVYRLQQKLGNELNAEEILTRAGLVTAAEIEDGTTIQITADKLKEALATGQLSLENYKLIASIFGVADANYGATVSFEILGASIKKAAIELWAFLSTNPVGWCILAAGAIALVVGAIDLFTVSLKEQQEITQKLQDEYNEITQKLSDVETELKTVTDRIDELNKKEHLSFVEQEELDKLTETNTQLERQNAILKEQQEIKGRELAKSIQAEYKKDFQDKDLSNDNASRNEKININLHEYQFLESSIDDLQKEINYIVQQGFEIPSEYQRQLDELKAKRDDIRKQLIDDAVDIQEYIDKYALDDDFAEQLQSDFEEIDRVLNPAEYKEIDFSRILNIDKFKDDVEEIKQLTKDGILDKTVLNKQFPELVEAMDEAGLSIDEIIEQFYSLNEVSDLENFEAPTESVTELSSALENFSKKTSAVKSAMEDMADTGYISADTYASLAELGGNFTKCLEIQDGKLTLNVEKLKELETQEYNNSIAANEAAIAELNYQLALSAGSASGANSKRIAELEERRNQLQEETAVWQEIIDEFNNISLDGDSSTPDSVLKFETELAKRQHEIATGKRKEDAAYYDWLESAAYKAYDGLADYEDELWKYQEQVYKWRKEHEQDLFDQKIENYEKLADKALEDNDFESARTSVNSEINETQNRIIELKASGKQDVDDEIEELTESLEELQDKITEINRSEIEFNIDQMNERLDELEEYAEKIEETYMTSDGTKLDSQGKWQEIKAVYTEAVNAIQDEINKIVQAGTDGNEDLLKELEEQLEEYQEKITDTFKSAVEEEQDYIEKQKDLYSDLYDERIDKIKEQQEAAEEAAQAEIDAIQEKIDALEKANEKAEEANNIEKARQELEKAKNQRTVATVSASGTIIYQADPDAVQEAQEEYDKLLLEQQINLLEDQKDVLEAAKDKQSEAYDEIIENLESQKEEGERQFDILLKALDEYLNPDKSTSNVDVWSELAKMQGAQYKNGVWADKDGNAIDLSALIKSAETESNAEKTVGTTSDNSKSKETKITPIEKKSFDSENETELNTESKTESALDKLFANWEKMFNLEKGSLTLEKAQQVLINSPSMNFNPYEAMNDRMNKVYKNEYVSNVNNNNSNSSNVTFSGDININNPVTNSYDLAEDIVKNLPNAVAKQIHKKNQ